MHKLFSAFATALVVGFAPGSAGFALAADLVVEVHNVKPRKGVVRAALFDNEPAFAAAVKIRAALDNGQITSGIFTGEGDFPREPVATAFEPARSRIVTLRFEDLEPGVYALGVYQDLNADERLDITLGGVSMEPWAVSNDAGKLDEDPRWETAKFSLPPEGGSMVVHLMDERRGSEP
jgi:uncharacterized protein (DUF2141 family)